MKVFLNLIKTNPKKAILVLISLLVFAIGTFLSSGCAFSIHGADNVSGIISPLR